MHPDDLIRQCRENGWRRELRPDEAATFRAWLAANPQAREDWQLELALTRALGGLPDTPVPSNFAARVREALEREQLAGAQASRGRWAWWRALGWAPRLAFASGLVAASLLSLRHYQVHTRQDFAESVAVLADSGVLADVEALQDFDTIQRLSHTPAPDEELLALLQ